MTIVLAPAKLTLTLRVIGTRPDGYHLIDAEMTSLDLHDVLEIDVDPDAIHPPFLSFTGPFSEGLVADDHNLVSRALRYARRQARIRLEKNIPHGGGLGGGSADAAAVLRWAGAGSDHAAIANELGADVPFCLVGGRARVRGIGEIIEPLASSPGTVTLVIPPFSVATPAVYRAWDELGGPTADGPNDLEPAALVVEPRLADWRDRIIDATGSVPVLAGSGATWFVVGDHGDAARQEFGTGSNTHVIVTRHA